MPTREPDLAERNSGRIETRADYITPEAQADGPLSKLRALLEEGLRGRIFTRFRQALERLKNSTNQKIKNELRANSQAETEDNTSQAELEDNTSKAKPEDDISKKYGQIATIKISRRRALKLLCGLVTTAAVAPFLPEGLGKNRTASAAETRTPITKPNETEASVPELERIITEIITEAKDFIASKVPMLEAYPDTLQPMERTNAAIGLQIPSDIGNPPSPDPKKPNKSGFELGSRIYSPYPDSK